MAEWLKGCDICNAGLCARFDELIGQGMSQRQAAKEIEKKQAEQLGEVVYPWNTLWKRFQRTKPPMTTNVVRVESETRTVSDLQTLIDAGKKFGTIRAAPLGLPRIKHYPEHKRLGDVGGGGGWVLPRPPLAARGGAVAAPRAVDLPCLVEVWGCISGCRCPGGRGRPRERRRYHVVIS